MQVRDSEEQENTFDTKKCLGNFEKISFDENGTNLSDPSKILDTD